MVKRYSKLKPTGHYLWQYVCLSVLSLLGISILETWPSKISAFQNGLFYDKNYILALANGFSGTQTDYFTNNIINITGENLIVILIMVVFTCGIIGFISDTFILLKLLKRGFFNLIGKIRNPGLAITFCLILLSLFGCNRQTNPTIGTNKEYIIIPSGFENFGGKRIFVSYNTPIEGYEVKAMVYADSAIATGYRALLDFSKDGKSVSQIETTDFFLPEIKISDLKNGEVIRQEYEAPSIDNSEQIKLGIFEKSPFFFLDIDFNGEKELILNKFLLGQRGMNAYKVMNINDPYLDYGTWQSNNPYGELDDETIVDYSSKTVKTVSIMSSCCEWWISTFNRGDGGWIRTIEKHEIQYDEENNPHEMIQTITYPEKYAEWRVANPEECILTNNQFE